MSVMPKHGGLANGSKYNRTDVKIAYGMIFPLLGLLSVFVIFPLFYALFVSFYQWSFYQESVFIGFHNYRLVLNDPLFYSSLWTGFKFALLVIPAQFVIAFLLAHLIKNLAGRIGGLVKTAIYIPNVVSGVIASLIFVFIYDYNGGIANYVIELLGFDQVAWLANPSIALMSISVPAIWMGLGITTLIMLAGLNDIPNEYYEAAVIDGASAFQNMIHITIPLLRNIFMYLLVVGLTGAVQQFDLPYVMTGGGPLNSTMTPNLFIYNHFATDPYMGYTVSAALLLFVILGTVSILIFKLYGSRKSIDS